MTAVNAAYTAGDIHALYDLAGEMEPGELRELAGIESRELRQLRERIMQCRRRRRKVGRQLQMLREDKTARLWRKARELGDTNEDWWWAVRRDLEAARGQVGRRGKGIERKGGRRGSSADYEERSYAKIAKKEKPHARSLKTPGKNTSCALRLCVRLFSKSPTDSGRDS